MVAVGDDAGSEERDRDWFERAIGATDEESEATDDGGVDGERSSEVDDVETAWNELGAAFDTDGDGDDSTADSTGDDNAATDDADDGELFDDDFGTALQNADGPTIDAGGGSGPGPDPSPDGFTDLDFGLGGPGDADFDAAVDSALPRLEVGIEGLDRMIQGGVPERSLIAAIGSAGTGKTTFGLQFLECGLARGESAVFITLEESRRRVLTSATEKGYPFDEYVDDGRLAIVDVDPVEMANSLSSITNELPALVEEFGASRLVLDSVSLLEMMYEDRATRRNEIYDFTRSLKDAGVTALVTSEAAEETAYASRYGIVEYLTDAVFVLQYVRPADFRETRLAIEIQKIRDANHSREKKPYEITGEGISVYQQANLF